MSKSAIRSFVAAIDDAMLEGAGIAQEDTAVEIARKLRSFVHDRATERRDLASMIDVLIGIAKLDMASVAKDPIGELKAYVFDNGTLDDRQADLEKRERDVRLRETELALPIPMRIACPDCGELHVDRGRWRTKPHHTHLCEECGLVWRPAVHPTVGVQFIFQPEDPDEALAATDARKEGTH